jgi:hypothetical protein
MDVCRHKVLRIHSKVNVSLAHRYIDTPTLRQHEVVLMMHQLMEAEKQGSWTEAFGSKYNLYVRYDGRIVDVSLIEVQTLLDEPDIKPELIGSSSNKLEAFCVKSMRYSRQDLLQSIRRAMPCQQQAEPVQQRAETVPGQQQQYYLDLAAEVIATKKVDTVQQFSSRFTYKRRCLLLSSTSVFKKLHHPEVQSSAQLQTCLEAIAACAVQADRATLKEWFKTTPTNLYMRDVHTATQFFSVYKEQKGEVVWNPLFLSEIGPTNQFESSRKHRLLKKARTT